jgi:hypothetical protein
MDQVNTLALFQYNVTVGTGVANKNLTVNGGLTVSGTDTFNGVATFNTNAVFNAAAAFINGLGTSANTNSTLYIGSSGNFYNRVFSGTPSCGGVTDGWTAIDQSALKLWVCLSGQAHYVQLN